MFQFRALSHEFFEHLYGLDDNELINLGVIPYIANTHPGFPCRVTLNDAEPGERLLLLNYEHLPVESPYRSSHAIFVKDSATMTQLKIEQVPEIVTNRLVSIRAFDTDDMMIDAAVIEGVVARSGIEKFLSNRQVSYLHVHTAMRGCFLAEVVRAD